ncbi:DNA polymerase III subunit delta [Viridibacillus arvi]|uniref:DNA polymerase III subunit delta n=1 Tax=Viridibacillus arvi TaxID=263475 RepID=UPI0034CECBEA
MSNIHLLYGVEDFLLNEKKEELLKGIEPFGISIHDMRESTVQNAIEDAMTLDLFGESKTIVLRDCYFLTGETKSKIEHDMDSLINYVNKPNDRTTLILLVHTEKLDKRKKVVKALLKTANTFEAKPMRNVQGWIQEQVKLEGKTITREAADLLVQRLGTNLFLLHNEINKIALSIEADTIQVDMLEDIISRTLDDDVFKLIDCVIRKENSALEILDDLFRLGEEPIGILLLIARQLRIIHQIKISHLNDEKPSNHIKVHPYVLQKAEEQASMYEIEIIQEMLQSCSELDLQMKRGQVNKHIAFETLIIQWL